MQEISVNKIETDFGPGMTQMGFAVNGRTTFIESYEGCFNRLKVLFFSSERIINVKGKFLIKGHDLSI
jgi:hypothetical protein